MLFTKEEEKELKRIPKCLWTTESTDVGTLTDCPPVKIRAKGEYLSNAFFSIPLHQDSRFWFAFTFEGKRYTYTRLPQGYAESPMIFAAAISNCFATFEPPAGKSQQKKEQQLQKAQLTIVQAVSALSRPSRQDNTDSRATFTETRKRVARSRTRPWEKQRYVPTVG